jgi:hypothetical protein
MHRNLLAPLLLFAIIQTASAHEANITRYLHVSASASCPGDVLLMNATGSDGLPAPDVELRLVLYYPYLGLRALQHTNQSGLAAVQLTKNGTYRIYISTDAYDHPKYVTFDYPAICPPPPPKAMDISVEPDCDAGMLRILAHSNGTPLESVFISAGNWSSLTGASGWASFPLEEGSVYIRAEKSNYSTREFFAEVSCAPPPECEADADCPDDAYCSGGNCLNVTGECGHPANHSWVSYECCSDAECSSESLCANNTCIARPAPPPAPPASNATASESANETQNTEPGIGKPDAGNRKPETPPAPCPASLLLLIPGILAAACR